MGTTRSSRSSVLRIGIEALLAERIAIHVVSVALPESWDVVVEELKPADPLHRLPRIKMRHDQPQRVAMVGAERLTIMVRGQQHVIAVEVGQRHVRGES